MLPEKYQEWRPFAYFVGVVVLVVAGITFFWPGIPNNSQSGNVNVSDKCYVTGHVTGNGNTVSCQPPAHAPGQKSARLEIGNFEVRGPNAKYEAIATLSVRNTTHTDATIIRSGSQFVYGSEMTAQEENTEWGKFVRALKREDNSTLQIIGEATLHAKTKFSVLGKEEYEMFQKGDFLIYFMFLMEYRDPNLAAGKYTATESCYFFKQNFSRLNLCHGHNRIYQTN